MRKLTILIAMGMSLGLVACGGGGGGGSSSVDLTDLAGTWLGAVTNTSLSTETSMTFDGSGNLTAVSAYGSTETVSGMVVHEYLNRFSWAFTGAGGGEGGMFLDDSAKYALWWSAPFLGFLEKDAFSLPAYTGTDFVASYSGYAFAYSDVTDEIEKYEGMTINVDNLANLSGTIIGFPITGSFMGGDIVYGWGMGIITLQGHDSDFISFISPDRKALGVVIIAPGILPDDYTWLILKKR